VEDADRLEDPEALFHLINIAGRTRGGLLLTARTLPASWATVLPDLKSRLNALPVAELAPPDDVVLTGVMRNLFRDRNIRASDELLAYLVRRIDRSIPEAQRMVSRLDDAADHQGRPVSRSLARQILEIDPVDGDLFDDL
jgi:chromosomal replication initiation ATPase DnaA